MDEAKKLLLDDVLEAYFESENENIRLRLAIAVLALINLCLIGYIALFL